MTTSTTDLATAMRTAEIRTTVTDGPTIERLDGWEHRAYWFRLFVRGEDLGGYRYRAGMAHEPPPSAVDLFGAILMDCASVEPYANDDAEEERNVWPQSRAAWPPRWEEWADDLGQLSGKPGALRQLADDFRDIMARRALLRARLGADVYDALIAIAQEL